MCAELAKKKLSVVSTLFRTGAYIEEFHNRIVRSCRDIFEDIEIIYVDDGSPDNAADIVRTLVAEESNVKLVELSRNFGHHPAMLTGLSFATGDLVFLIDCDLEEPPELIEGFYQQYIENEDTDVVYGVQAIRKGGPFERITGNLFYRAFNIVSSVKLPRNLITVRLMSKNYVEALLSYGERETIIAGLWELAGFNQVPRDVSKLYKGETSYSLMHKLQILVNAITSFSAKPLYFIFVLGLNILFASVVGVLVLMFRHFVLGIEVSGWTSIMVSLWFLGGLIMFSMGVIGIYLAKVFVETKKRPRAIVRRVYSGKSINED